MVAFIEALFDRHGVAERQRVRTLEATLGISYAQARRRMLGESPWTVDEVKRLVTVFHEPFFPVLAALADMPGQPATLIYAGATVPCTIWPGGTAVVGRLGPMVALHDEGSDQWSVVPGSEAVDRASYEVVRLVFERPPPRRVAVLDDDIESAQTIAEFLGTRGIEAAPFSCPSQLLSALETSHFDGFVLDWLLNGATALDILPQIRDHNQTGPLLILTGQLKTGVADEVELESVGGSYRALLFEKPTRPMTLLNALQVGFAASTPPPSSPPQH